MNLHFGVNFHFNFTIVVSQGQVGGIEVLVGLELLDAFAEFQVEAENVKCFVDEV